MGVGDLVVAMIIANVACHLIPAVGNGVGWFWDGRHNYGLKLAARVGKVWASAAYARVRCPSITSFVDNRFLLF